MFIGHAALALAAKKAAPRVSLGLLLAAATWLDLVWPLFVLLGVEQVRIAPGITVVTPLDFVSYPWTHSLLLALAWSLAFALAAAPLVRGARERLLLAGLVLSHWVLDWVAHRPDLPLLPGGTLRLGLGLWNSLPGTVLVEGSLMAAGVLLYLRATQPRDGIGRYALAALLVSYVGIWTAGLASPPPPNARVVAWVGLASWLFPLWAGWADAHRSAVVPAQAGTQAQDESPGFPPARE
jgi:hypothetical protein